MSFSISKVYLAAILNFSKCSMIPARHHADHYSTWLPLPKLAKTCCGGIFARLPRFVASGNQTNMDYVMKKVIPSLTWVASIFQQHMTCPIWPSCSSLHTSHLHIPIFIDHCPAATWVPLTAAVSTAWHGSPAPYGTTMDGLDLGGEVSIRSAWRNTLKESELMVKIMTQYLPK